MFHSNGPVATWLGSAFVFAVLGLMPSTAQAQDAESRVSGTVGGDATHAYFFRGIVQEREGFIFQPYGEIDFRVFEGAEGLTGVDFFVGMWNSWHSAATTADNPIENVKMWYESDFYTGVTLGLDNWEAGITYTSYMSPNQSFGIVKELSLGLSMDDSAFFGAYSMAPHVLIAIELAGQADGGASEGVYLELGVEPGFEPVVDRVTLGFPVTIGLSLSNYYENGDDLSNSFGYFDVGAVVTAPLTAMPASFGDWEVSGGVKFLALGDYLKTLNGGDKYQPIGFFGFSIGY